MPMQNSLEIDIMVLISNPFPHYLKKKKKKKVPIFGKSCLTNDTVSVVFVLLPHSGSFAAMIVILEFRHVN